MVLKISYFVEKWLIRRGNLRCQLFGQNMRNSVYSLIGEYLWT